ncbi:MAG: hypothetical protein ACYS9C_14605 [Planctomycetota bacterium]|jgi:ADP-ribosylglycohydrolase
MCCRVFGYCPRRGYEFAGHDQAKKGSIVLGAIAGDIVGSVYENFRTKRKDFKLFTPVSTFTDDTVLTVAVADAILTGGDYGRTIKSYARRHPMCALQKSQNL